MLSLTNKKQLSNNSLSISNLTRAQVKVIQESLGSIRDVLLDGNQNNYLELFQASDRPMRRMQAQSNFLASYPRFCLEALGMVLISSFAVYLTLQSLNSDLVVPLLGTLALGAQRLLPALQQVYFSWANVKHFNSSVSDILNILNQPVFCRDLQTRIQPLSLTSTITFRNVSFSYPSSPKEIISNINFELIKGQHLGIIGATGSGKSTFVDLLMGLLEPTSGRILVDNHSLFTDSKTQPFYILGKHLLHVPQSIYLADLTIAENIAFSVRKEQIDLDLVKKVSHMANIAAYIESLPSQYSTYVGEGGINLSGGQRQRIGIARALYKQSQILVFDEATSALDIQTEIDVINTIHSTLL